MFKATDFEITLECKLRQRVMFDEIDQCTDIDVLKENLKNVTSLFMRYQHLLNTVLAKQLEKSIDDFLLEAKDNDKEVQS